MQKNRESIELKEVAFMQLYLRQRYNLLIDFIRNESSMPWLTISCLNFIAYDLEYLNLKKIARLFLKAFIYRLRTKALKRLNS